MEQRGDEDCLCLLTNNFNTTKATILSKPFAFSYTRREKKLSRFLTILKRLISMRSLGCQVEKWLQVQLLWDSHVCKLVDLKLLCLLLGSFLQLDGLVILWDYLFILFCHIYKKLMNTWMNESLVIRVKLNNWNAIHTCWEKQDQFLQWSDML